MPLETEATAAIRSLIADLKPDDGDLLEALHRVQHRYGYIGPEAMQVIAEQLRLTTAHVYGATTYYADFRTTPPPPVTVAWCAGSACRLRNGLGILHAMEAVLNTTLNAPQVDGRVGLITGQCNGTCEQAPQVWVNERVVGRLNAARAVEIARALRDGIDPNSIERGPRDG